MERARSITILVGLLLGSAATVTVSPAPPAAAQSPGGSFTCRASAVNLVGVEPVVANPGGGPCPTETRSVLDAPVGSLAVRAVTASTQPLPGGGGATSRSLVIGLDLASLGLRADVAEAEATVECEGDRPRLVGTSRVLGLVVNGRAFSSAETAVVPLPVGTLHLNQAVLEGDTLIRRAVHLETPLGSVVVGEARVGYAGSPCVANGTITFVVAGGSRNGHSFTGDVGVFSVPDNGQGTGATRRSFSRPAGRYRIRQLDPPDELQNAGGEFPYVLDNFLNDLRCEDPDGGTTTDLSDSRVDVDLDPGEEVVCFFSNGSTAVLAPNADIENPTQGVQPGGFVQNPSTGVNPVAFDQGLGSRSQAGVQPPSAPRPGAAGDEGDGGGDPSEGISASILSGGTLFAVPTLAILFGAGLWYWLLAGGKRRRKDEEGEPA